MVFGSTAPIFFFLLLWVGGLGTVLGWLVFARFVRSASARFDRRKDVPLLCGLGFSWAVGALLALLWDLDAVSRDFMELAPVVALVATAAGLSAAYGWTRSRSDR